MLKSQVQEISIHSISRTVMINSLRHYHSTHTMTDVRHYGFKGVVITESVGLVDKNSFVGRVFKMIQNTKRVTVS